MARKAFNFLATWSRLYSPKMVKPMYLSHPWLSSHHLNLGFNQQSGLELMLLESSEATSCKGCSFLLDLFSFCSRLELSYHVMRNRGYRPTARTNLLSMEEDTLELNLPAPVKPSDAGNPGRSLTAASWETLSQNHTAKPLLNSWPTEFMRHNKWLLFF